MAPSPDPTKLTTDAVAALRRELTELFGERLSGMETVMLEKFVGVEKELALIERQRVEQKQDTKAAVDAALQAAKEAVKEQTTASERAIAKSEAATTKSIDQLSEKQDATESGLRREINDVKERVGGSEQRRIGGQQASAALYAFAGFVVALLLIGGIVASRL